MIFDYDSWELDDYAGVLEQWQKGSIIAEGAGVKYRLYKEVNDRFKDELSQKYSEEEVDKVMDWVGGGEFDKIREFLG